MKTILMMIATAALCAASTVFSLNSGVQCTGGCGPAPYGTVSLTQNGTQVDVLATLEPGNFFVQTGGPHRAFAFQILGDPAIAITGLSAGFAFTGDSAPWAGYGTFGYAIIGPDPSNHCCSNLAFTVGRVDLALLSVADFAPNDQGFSFEADIYGGATGNTGEVGAFSLIPEPESVGLIGVGLALLAWRARRRK